MSLTTSLLYKQGGGIQGVLGRKESKYKGNYNMVENSMFFLFL